MDIESECPHQQNDSQEDRETSDSDGADDRRTSRIVRKNYISMIALAYAMTGVSVWSSSYACRAQIGVSTTTSNAADAMDSRQADDLSSCAAYRGDLILALAKLTLATALLVVSFFNLQGSDPGFVSKELMERLDRVEGRESQHDAEQQRFLDSTMRGMRHLAAAALAPLQGEPAVRCHLRPPLRLSEHLHRRAEPLSLLALRLAQPLLFARGDGDTDESVQDKGRRLVGHQCRVEALRRIHMAFSGAARGRAHRHRSVERDDVRDDERIGYRLPQRYANVRLPVRQGPMQKYHHIRSER
ncbi:hypothetical protein THAOC_04089 [Thalassiosira oceanica]|uniref:Uncharacterized protein n=1 Tax=Thalassiosira oceanica TaxID=159749 RepID=K0TP80_THAOC|nr:hypothetical protein THAOC_04089 [Thalassiosira oceanica]|eukprot:EJK74242.1 hypothetical protein THAOC_04089 [Thalassiosira oceanica]